MGEENIASTEPEAYNTEDDADTASNSSEPDPEVAREYPGESQLSAGPPFLDIEAVLRDHKRIELEESLGCALWEIPHFVMAIWRLDALACLIGHARALAKPHTAELCSIWPLPCSFPYLSTTTQMTHIRANTQRYRSS